MKRNLFIIAALLFSCNSLYAQQVDKSEEVYTKALELYEQQRHAEAAIEFEKVLTLNPKHKDAMYNLGVIHYNLGNNERAIDVLQRSVKLGDRDAAKLLKEKLQQTIVYADTMYFEDVDVLPKVKVKSAFEDAITKVSFYGVALDIGSYNLHDTLLRSFVNQISKSSIVGTHAWKHGGLLHLNVYFGLDGNLYARLRDQEYDDVVQKVISRATEKVNKVTPGKHQGQNVVVQGPPVIIRFAEAY